MPQGFTSIPALDHFWGDPVAMLVARVERDEYVEQGVVMEHFQSRGSLWQALFVTGSGPLGVAGCRAKAGGVDACNTEERRSDRRSA